MIYIKRVIIITTLILFFTIALISFQFGQVSTVRTMSTFFTPSDQPLPPNIDELLEKAYGNSKFFDSHGDIKISLEKVVNEKFFIEYSWVNGDESYFGVGLIIENLNGEALNKDDFDSVWIKDDLGNGYIPLPYQQITDFPPDRPLGWKQLYYGKFPTIETEAKSITIHFKYQDYGFVIKDVPI